MRPIRIRRVRWIGLIAGALVAAIVLVVVLRSPASASSTVLSVLSGVVDAAHAERGFTAAVDGEVLVDGDGVRTGADGHALLTFFDASTIEVEPATQIAVQSARPAGDAIDIRLTQTIGHTWSSVQHLRDPASRYEIHTPSAVAAVRGTGLDVTVLADGTSTVRVTDGTVVVTAQGQSVLVNAGQQNTTVTGSPPGPPGPITPPPNALRFGMHSPAYIAAVDPTGRACGIVMPGPTVVRQIPGCLATAPGIEPQIVDVPGASPGEYRVAIYGKGDGDFTLTATALAGDKVSFNSVTTGKVKAGDLLGSAITVRGAPDGSLRSDGLAAPTLVSSEPVKVVLPSAPSSRASGAPPSDLFSPLPVIGFDIGPVITNDLIAAPSPPPPSSAPPSSAPPSSAPPSSAPPSSAPPSSAPPSSAPPSSAPPSSAPPSSAPPSSTPSPAPAPTPTPTAAPPPSPTPQPSATVTPTTTPTAGAGGVRRTPLPTAPTAVAQTITFNALSTKTYGDADFAVNATASSGLAVTFSAAGDCSVSGATVHITGAGTCSVMASQGGNGTYAAADDVLQTFPIAKASQTITFAQPTSPAAVNTTFAISPTSTSGLTVTVSSSGPCSLASLVATMTWWTGTCTLTAAQAGNSNYNAATSVARSVTASAPSAGTIWTYAGTTTAGFAGDGGLAPSAQLDQARNMVVDASGNVYIADLINDRVRKVATNGTITTIAGGGASYGDAGPATSALLLRPIGLAFDSSGNLYIADSNHHTVRKVDTNGNISTVAGTCCASGSSGDGGLATAATLTYPYGIAFDASGDLYIGGFDDRVRKVDSGGHISTFAGTGTPGYSGDNGPATSAQLNDPLGVAVDASGNVFISERTGCRIRKVTTGGTISTYAGTGTCGTTGDGGAATSAQIAGPDLIAFDATRSLYFPDAGSVRKVTPAGTVLRYAGTGVAGYSGDNGPKLSAQLNEPVGVAFDTAGNLYIGDDFNSRIRRVEAATQTITFNALSDKTFGDPDFSVSATASSGLTVTFSASGNCTVSGTTVHLTATGSCTITVSQPGDATYAAAADVARSFNIAAAGSSGLLAWGYNGFGEFGNASTTDSSTPVAVTISDGVVALAGGNYHSLALKSDGTVRAWGLNDLGQIGDGTSANTRTTPVQVCSTVSSPGVCASSLSGVVAIAGWSHSLALKSDGTVWAWGRNTSGQLGNGTNANSSLPVQVKGENNLGFLTGVVAIAAGESHSLAVKSDGSVWAWGYGGTGQLGYGSTSNSSTPVQVGGGLSGVVAISAGGNHSLALKSDGTVRAWGYDLYGQLGNGTSGSGQNTSTPVQVCSTISAPGICASSLGDVVAIAAGANHSLALKSDGTVRAWGYGGNGQLGNGGTSNSSTPLSVGGGLSSIVAIAGGHDLSLALKSDGTAWAWGVNDAGLDTNTTTRSSNPVAVSGLSGVVAIAGGGYHSLALTGSAVTPSVVANVTVGTAPIGVGVDPQTGRFYVANIGSNDLTVIDGGTDTVIATIPVGVGPVGVSVDPITNRIYVADNGGNQVSVIDGATNSVLTAVQVGSGPFGVAVNSLTDRIYVANQSSNNVSVIDGATNAVIATIGVGASPCCVAVDPLSNRVYVSNVTSGSLTVIDGATNAVAATVPVGCNPTGIAVDPTTHRIYVARCFNVAVLDGATNAVLASVSVGTSPSGIAVDPVTNTVYVTNAQSDSISVINGWTNAVVSTVGLAAGSNPQFVAVDPLTGRLFVSDFANGSGTKATGLR